MNRFLTIPLFLILLAIPAAAADSPTDAAREMFQAMQARNWDKMTEYYHPEALQSFRKMMKWVEDIPEEAEPEMLSMFFGEDMDAGKLSKLTDAEFFAAFMNGIFSKMLGDAGMAFDDPEILGTVAEGDLQHLVARVKVAMQIPGVEKMEIRGMEVVTFKKHEGEWKALLSGEIEGMAQAMSAGMKQAWQAQDNQQQDQ